MTDSTPPIALEQAPIAPDQFVIEIASFGLRSLDLPSRFDDEHWQRLHHLLHLNRITGLALAAVEAGELHLSESQLAALIEANTSIAGFETGLDSLLLYLNQELAQFEPIVLKGAAHARLDYPDSRWRNYGDIDLLVRGKDFNPVRSFLENIGFARMQATPLSSRWEAEFAKSITVARAPNVEIDLHRTLTSGAYGLAMNEEVLREDLVEFDYDGQRLRALSQETRLIQSCLHLSIGSFTPRLSTVRDVVQLLPTTIDGVSALARRCSKLSCAVPVARSIVTASERLKVHPGVVEEWAIAQHSTARDRVILRTHAETGAFRAQALVGVLGVHGLGSRIRYLRGFLRR